MYLSLSLYIYIYIYLSISLSPALSLSLYIYIYTHIHVCIYNICILYIKCAPRPPSSYNMIYLISYVIYYSVLYFTILYYLTLSYILRYYITIYYYRTYVMVPNPFHRTARKGQGGFSAFPRSREWVTLVPLVWTHRFQGSRQAYSPRNPKTLISHKVLKESHG